MCLMFRGTGEDSDTESADVSHVLPNGQTRFSLKLLYFFSGIALLALLLSVFVQTSVLYAVFSAGVCAVFFFVWLWAVFEFDVAKRLKVASSKALSVTASCVSAVLCLIGIFLAGTSLVYASDVMLKTYEDFIELILSHVRESFQNIANLLMSQSEIISWAAAVVFGVLSFVLVYAILKRLIAGRYSDIVKKEGLSSVLLFALASALWVFVPLLPLYMTNIDNVSLLFVLLLAVVYMLGTVAVYFISLFISRSALASFGVCVVAWIGLSMSEGIITGFLSGIPFATVIYSAVLLGVMCLGGFGILKAAEEFELSSKKLSKILIALVAVLLVINIVPIAAYNITSADAVADASEGMTFVVDDSLDHPNIYWIHAESMVDETVLEKYWGEDTVGFTEKLEERGFYVNHEAYINGPLFSGLTTESLASMYLPNFSDRMNEVGLSRANRAITFTYLEGENEFINAFDSAGYKTVAHMSPWELNYVRLPAGTIYCYDDEISVNNNTNVIGSLDKIIYFDLKQQILFLEYSAYPIWVLSNCFHVEDKCLNQYLKKHIVVSLENYVSDEEKYGIFQDTDWLEIDGHGSLISSVRYSLDISNSPELMFIFSNFAHTNYDIDEFGGSIETTNNVYMYYGEYLFSSKLILYYVDEILEKDSNAIIIIQGDHGPHIAGYDGYDEFFSSDPRYEEYKGHVLSAVRIPEQYQTEDYPEAIQNPRNIVRYLVNSYVGENYEYIPWEEA